MPEKHNFSQCPNYYLFLTLTIYFTERIPTVAFHVKSRAISTHFNLVEKKFQLRSYQVCLFRNTCVSVQQLHFAHLFHLNLYTQNDPWSLFFILFSFSFSFFFFFFFTFLLYFWIPIINASILNLFTFGKQKNSDKLLQPLDWKICLFIILLLYLIFNI